MIAQPTGTVTFLFTDIEGSTKLWEQYPEAMQNALARHDELLRQIIERHNGYVFKTVGDAFCAAFARVPDALNAAIAVQRALSTENWEKTPIKVRMALHTGAAEEREGDYFGPPVNRVTRLLSAGHGGQILLSLAAEELLRSWLPEHVDLYDLGDHRLKDLIHPEHIFQVIAPGLPADFPPLRTLDMRPNNLPAQTTTFIGRETELATVLQELTQPDIRLLTLTGTGGTGKTRLGLQIAAHLLEDFVDGVFFISLAPVSDPELIIPTILQMFDVQIPDNKLPLDVLKSYLKDRQMLLVLDNFEHVVQAASTVSDLLAAAPRLKVLVTSRILLRISGERDYLVPPLRLPDPRELPALQNLTRYEAVQLFIERGRAVKSNFTLTNENASAVVDICSRLDGLPLAIELAAARVRLLSPQKMLTRLNSRLGFLTGGARDLPARQQTLRSTIDWSYNLLDMNEKTLFWRLVVFVGGCTLEAAEAVCELSTSLSAGSGQIVDVLSGLEGLIDNSLVREYEIDGEPRFTMLETIREYSSERLAESGEEAPIRQRHAQFFLKLAEEIEPKLYGTEQAAWSNRLKVELDNLRTALRWSIDNEIKIGLQLAGALGRFWNVCGLHSEGRDWSARALAKSKECEPHIQQFRAKLLYEVGRLARTQGDFTTARTLLEEAVALGRESDDKRGLAQALCALGGVVCKQGDPPSARLLIEESTTLFRQLDDKDNLIIALFWYGHITYVARDYETSHTVSEECIHLAQEIGDISYMAGAIGVLASIAFDQGDYPATQSLNEKSLKLFREVEDKVGIGFALRRLGELSYTQGAYEQAAIYYEESLEIWNEIGSKPTVAWLHISLGYVASNQLDWQAARTHFAESLSLHQELENRAGIAACLSGLAAVLEGQGQPEQAAQLLGCREALLETRNGFLRTDPHLGEPFIQTEHEQIVAAVRDALGEEAFAAAYAKGREMTLEQAIEYGLENTIKEKTEKSA